jgi:hypothetical protein
MQPFERLRSLARWSADDESSFVAEAADCLAAFDGDPAGLVVACRRLLVHHPASGPLWWLCARVLCAPDPSEAAWQAWKLLGDDPTPARLAALLPFPHDEPVATLGWPSLIATALVGRPDLDVVVVRRPTGDEHLAARLRRAEQPIRVISGPAALDCGATHLLVEVAAVGMQRALVTEGTGELLTALRRAGCVTWLVAGVGRVLPERLFDAMVRHLTAADDVELIGLEVVERVAGPAGLDAPDGLLRRADCPIAPELLRFSD